MRVFPCHFREIFAFLLIFYQIAIVFGLFKLFSDAFLKFVFIKHKIKACKAMCTVNAFDTSYSLKKDIFKIINLQFYGSNLLGSSIIEQEAGFIEGDANMYSGRFVFTSL